VKWSIAYGLVLFASLVGCEHRAPIRPPPNPTVLMNPIVTENQLPGSEGWFVPYPQWAMNHEVEGYTDRPSYSAGETVKVKVSAQFSPVTWTLYRTGWYGGIGARALVNGQAVATQQILPPTSTWDVPCEPNWPTTFSVELGHEFVSGVYALKLTAGALSSMITFVVRDDDRKSELVFQRSDFTDAMYNNWDGASNRSSYYGDHPQWVSLDRVMRSPAGWLYPYSAGYFTYEYSMVRFLEREGYDVKYISNLDVHQAPHLLDEVQTFLSVGHDEYWSAEMRDSIENARNRGMNIGFFSSDMCDGVVRVKSDDPHAFSVATVDATAANRARNEWASKAVNLTAPPHDNPTDTLSGTHYGGWCAQPHPDCVSNPFTKLTETDPLTITAPTHPLLRNVTLQAGSTSSVMGYEYEVLYSGTTPLPFVPVVIGDVASIAPATLPGKGSPVALAYQYSSGARIFNAGAMHWSHGLDPWVGQTAFRNMGGEQECAVGQSDCFDVADLGVRQLTVNVLDDMGGRRGSPSPDLVDSGPCDWLNPAAGCR
jgi:hypothetical protein